MSLCSVCGETLPLGRIEGKAEPVGCDTLCVSCGSTSRQRGMARGVLTALRLHVPSISSARMDKSRFGIGISDWYYLGGILAFKYTYANSYYHQFPRIDLRKPPEELIAKCEFITCSDVLEHVLPPIDESVAGLKAMLKSGGYLVVSVPIHKNTLEIHEHYDLLNDYRVDQAEGQVKVTGYFEGGREQEIKSPIFHGGPGHTLEIRRFSASGIRGLLRKHGFEIEAEITNDPDFGIPSSTAPVFVCRRI